MSGQVGRVGQVSRVERAGHHCPLLRTPSRLLALMPLTSLLIACAGGARQPGAIDTVNDACHRCRMIVSDARLAAQIVAPGDDSLIFDDLGCLRDHLASAPVARDAALYVADHRTGEWVPAEDAVYTRVESAPTPMASHLVAHASVSSRDADPSTRGGEAVPVTSILGPAKKEARLP